MNLYSIKGLYLIFILMMTFPCAICAQRIGFTYDASGDQILREANYSRSRGMDMKRDSVSTDRMQTHKITVSPNPTEGPLRVVVANLQDEDDCSLTLFDSAGKQMLFQQVTKEVNFLDLSSFTTGYYILRCAVNGECESIKIIKE